MKKLLLCVFCALVFMPVIGCSDPKPVVTVDDRSEAEKQAEFADYDKQMAEDAKSYEAQQGGN